MPNECSQCQATLTCSANQHCWCMSLPNILPLQSNGNCLCQACLLTKINMFLADQYQSQPVKTLLKLAEPYRSTPANIAGLDYTIEHGSYIFSRWAHLKRGYCCGNGCKHCPWQSMQTL